MFFTIALLLVGIPVFLVSLIIAIIFYFRNILKQEIMEVRNTAFPIQKMINYETARDVTSKDYISAMKKADDVAAVKNSFVNYTVGSSYTDMFMSVPGCLFNSRKFRMMVN
ncbi:hypothetical protein BB560_000071 [Smittium megazygosporum]|uniref:Uncharacterized protein n=1 Tax=Smittium megazygosporum TaxID=133381 RepID=A0A2T9ZLE2_9FUNG|nr:hypothetical protein BB560_000071 [Smittium megazygosporum]